MSNLNNALSGIVSNIDALASKVTENKAALENKVSYVSDESGRTKSILLNNNEMILGSSTDTPASGGFVVEGGANNHNLVMVNKWNVVDVGTSNLPLTLNSISGVVTIQNGNDKKIVATVDQIPEIPEVDVDGIAAEASGAVVDYLGVQDVDGKIRFSQEKFPGMYSVSDYTPAAGDFVYLNNNAKIASELLPDLEILLDGIFIGADYGNLGSSHNQTLDNIVFHASNGGVAINAANGVVYIPTTEYSSPSTLVADLMGMEPSAQLEFIENHRVITVDGKLAARALPEEAVTVDDLSTTLEDYATTVYVDEKVSSLGAALKVVGKVDTTGDLPQSAKAGDIYLVPEGDETAEYVYVEGSGFEKLGTTTKVDLSAYATTTSVDEKIAEVNASIEETNTAVEAAITTAKEYTDEKFVESDNSLSGLLTKISELQSKIESI